MFIDYGIKVVYLHLSMLRKFQILNKSGLYESVSLKVLRDYYDSHEFDIFDLKEIDVIDNLFDDYTSFYMEEPGGSEVNVYKSGLVINRPIFINMKSNEVIIYKYIDEWYFVLVKFYGARPHPRPRGYACEYDIYKCDTFEGVKNLFKDI